MCHYQRSNCCATWRHALCCFQAQNSIFSLTLHLHFHPITVYHFHSLHPITFYLPKFKSALSLLVIQLIVLHHSCHPEVSVPGGISSWSIIHLTTTSVWLQRKSLWRKQLIRQAASLNHLLPARVKAPNITSVHNKTLSLSFLLSVLTELYTWCYQLLFAYNYNRGVHFTLPPCILNTVNLKVNKTTHKLKHIYSYGRVVIQW